MSFKTKLHKFTIGCGVAVIGVGLFSPAAPESLYDDLTDVQAHGMRKPGQWLRTINNEYAQGQPTACRLVGMAIDDAIQAKRLGIPHEDYWEIWGQVWKTDIDREWLMKASTGVVSLHKIGYEVIKDVYTNPGYVVKQGLAYGVVMQGVCEISANSMSDKEANKYKGV